MFVLSGKLKYVSQNLTSKIELSSFSEQYLSTCGHSAVVNPSVRVTDVALEEIVDAALCLRLIAVLTLTISLSFGVKDSLRVSQALSEPVDAVFSSTTLTEDAALQIH